MSQLSHITQSSLGLFFFLNRESVVRCFILWKICRLSLSLIAIFFQVDIYAGSVFLYEAVGWNIYISAACILAITAVYTVLGKIVGFKSKLHD